MKLKKIASLMLAGIMAVSMLAACGEGKGNSSSSSSSSQVTTSNAVTYANNALTGDQKKIMEFSNDPDLDKALAAATKDYSKVNSTNIHNVYGLQSATTGNGADKILSAVKNSLNANDFKANIPSSAFATLTNTGVDKYGQVYLVSGMFNEESAVTAAVNAFDSGNSEIKGLLYALSNANYKATYEANISTVKMSNPEKPEETAWVIAIVVTQTVTEI